MADPIRFSALKRMARSPMHYAYGMEREQSPTSAMMKGSAVHSIIASNKRVIAYAEGKQRRGAEYEAFKAQNPDALILTSKEYDTSAGMVEAVRNHSEAMELLTGAGSHIEETILFDYCGRAARSTPDTWKISAGRGHVVELKTTQTSEPDMLMRHCARLHYHAQLAFHAEALKTAHGAHTVDAYLVAVEATAPHPVTILCLSATTLDIGARCVRLWFERLLECERSNVWPPYVQSPVEWNIEEDPELTFGSEEAA